MRSQRRGGASVGPALCGKRGRRHLPESSGPWRPLRAVIHLQGRTSRTSHVAWVLGPVVSSENKALYHAQRPKARAQRPYRIGVHDVHPWRLLLRGLQSHSRCVHRRLRHYRCLLRPRRRLQRRGVRRQGMHGHVDERGQLVGIRAAPLLCVSVSFIATAPTAATLTAATSTQ